MKIDFLDGRPKVAFYGDDFTGASDTLATAAQAGLRSLLLLRVPDAAQWRATGPLDCVGIAGAARSMTPSQMTAALAPVARFFAGLHVPVTHYKICSTFDSAPQVGNIGAALATWRRFIANPFVPLVGGQPNLRRYCLFSHLYAAAQAGGEVVRIDRHPTMRHHPVTPMGESDLRVHLRGQGLHVVGMHYPVYADVDALDAQIDAVLAKQPETGAILFDVASEADLAVIGRMIWTRATQAPLLAVGASSVTRSLAAWWRAQGWISEGRGDEPIAPARGPVFVLAGSLSPVTALQIEGARTYERVALDAQRLHDGDHDYLQTIVAHITRGLRDGRNMLACTAEPGGDGDRRSVAGTDAAQRLAMAGGRLLHEVLWAMAQQAPDARLMRVGVAGGDTSSHALQALDIWGLSWRGNLSPGVALCRAHADAAHLDGVELMLKGGQMGTPDLFDRLVSGRP